MTSVDSNFNFLCGRPHGAGPPFPLSTCVHLSPTPSPLRVDGINGWPLTQKSFWIFLKRLFKSTTTQRRSRHSTDTVSEFHAEAPQATVSEGFAQGPYVAARDGFKPTALQTTAIDSSRATTSHEV